MSFLVAVAGKGGVGKSTISALLVRILSEKGTVLAVDADPNSNLGEKLGMEVPGTVGDLREGLLTRQGEMPKDMSKQEYLMLKLRQILAEGDSVDLLTMGRPEGPGCYCYVNNLLRVFVDRLMEPYPFTIIDNEAGMEHLSRRTARGIDLLLLVSDPTPTGIATARRLSELADELGLKVGRKVLLVNGVRQGEGPAAERAASASGVEFHLLPYDEGTRERSMAGSPVEAMGPLAEGLRQFIPGISPSGRRREG